MTPDWILSALERLQARDFRVAEVFRRRFIARHSEAEIAKALGVTERTVRRDIQKARLLLLAMPFGPTKDGDAEMIGSPTPPKPPQPLSAHEKEPGDNHGSE